MGNTGSIDVNIDVSRQDDDDNYNIDAEEVGRDDALTVPTVQTPIDMRFSKMYIIYQRVNGASRTFALTIKILDDNIFLYVTDVLSEKTVLAHVSRIHKEETMSVKPNIESVPVKSSASYYLKYIQISRDFRYISLPENGYVNVYSLTKLLNRNILQYVDSVGIVLREGPDGTIRTGIEVDSRVDRSMSTKTLNADVQQDMLGKIDFHYVDCNIQPYKCILCKDMFVVVCSEYNRFKKIVVINYKAKLVHEIKNLDIDANRSALKFSTDGRHIAIYNGAKNTLSVCDMTARSPQLKSVPLTIKDDTMLESVCVSEDGRFLFFVENMMFNVYDIPRNRTYVMSPGTSVDQMDVKDIKFHLMDYSRFSDIVIESETDCDSLYVLVGWNRKKTSALYWMIRCDKIGYSTYGPTFVDMKVEGTIDYIYNNGYMFIYKTEHGITAYDLNKVIPIRFAGMLASGAKRKLNKLYRDNYQDVRDQYYTYIDVVGADDSKARYNVNDYMMFLLSLKKSQIVGTDTNIFQLRINANIDVYGSTKSFNVFQDLLSGKINQREIIDNIYTIQGATGRHNMMAELMAHLYEFTRVIALKETSDGDLDRSGFSNMKAMYIGYVLLVLVLKYYSMLFKTVGGIKSSVRGKNKTLRDPRVQSTETTIRYDILEAFNNNFPAFKSFTMKSIELMMGERLD
ncbi:hypothetical protein YASMINEVIRUS_479 [Yasminevirus sp. GU-2018]|uniref:Uncharacterized protein n=1 Tax=Yasminevirus sp. GU-2018 TaxID=2420051 RepID=A0A5K0UA93_9VIRU|nr:hypothetical protein YASMINEVIRUS_479 [Yasminevirus sp. GU-2018]